MVVPVLISFKIDFNTETVIRDKDMTKDKGVNPTGRYSKIYAHKST